MRIGLAVAFHAVPLCMVFKGNAALKDVRQFALRQLRVKVRPAGVISIKHAFVA